MQTRTLNFSLYFDVNLRHKIFLNLKLGLRKDIIQNLETKKLIIFDYFEKRILFSWFNIIINILCNYV